MKESHDSQENISNKTPQDNYDYDFARFVNSNDTTNNVFLWGKFNDFLWSPDSLYLNLDSFNYDMGSKKSDEIFKITQNKNNIIISQVNNQNNIKLISPAPKKKYKIYFYNYLNN